jgi:hypothetical protein
MTRTSNLVWVVALGVGIVAPLGACNFTAGVKSPPPVDAAGTTGAGGSVGGTGNAGSSGNVDAASPFDFGGQYTSSGAGGGGPCTGLTCQQSTCRGQGCSVTCPVGYKTTVSGKVYDPAGKTPLYNITVYVPNGPLADFTDGPSCDKCDPNTGTSLLSGSPVVYTKTDTKGAFSLGSDHNVDVPAGKNIPMVLQVGKWRRQVTIPEVKACADNPITDMSLLHLPQTSKEGHIPKIAITTGAKDALQCLLLKVGVDKSEFTPETAAGRINLYAGGGGAAAYDMTLNNAAPFTAAAPWWDSYDNLAKYDILLHSCDGSGYDPAQIAMGVVDPKTGLVRGEPAVPKSMAARMALEKFANAGGRVFASHWHAYWFAEGTPAFKSIATWGLNDRLMNMATIDQSFDTGSALAQWMMNVGGSTALGQVDITQDASNRLIDMAAGGNISQRWIYSANQTPQSVVFLSATTPIPGGTCGRAVVSDLHLIAATGVTGADSPTAAFPGSCVTTDLTPREKVLEFMLFDIASCVAPPVDRAMP